MPSKYATMSNLRCDEMTSHVRIASDGLSSLIILFLKCMYVEQLGLQLVQVYSRPYVSFSPVSTVVGSPIILQSAIQVYIVNSVYGVYKSRWGYLPEFT